MKELVSEFLSGMSDGIHGCAGILGLFAGMAVVVALLAGAVWLVARIAG